MDASPVETATSSPQATLSSARGTYIAESVPAYPSRKLWPKITRSLNLRRTRDNPQKAGTAFETSIAAYLAHELDSDFIERRHRRCVTLQTQDYRNHISSHVADVRRDNRSSTPPAATVQIVTPMKKQQTPPPQQMVAGLKMVR